RPERNVGKGVSRFDLFRFTDGRTEQRDLSGDEIFLLERRLSDGDVECGGKLCPVPAEGIHRTGEDQRLEHPLVADAQVDTLAKVEQGAEGSVLRSRGEYRIDRCSSDVADAAEPKTNPGVTDDGELVTRFVDVGRQDLQS